jgi:hypothetical protein
MQIFDDENGFGLRGIDLEWLMSQARIVLVNHVRIMIITYGYDLSIRCRRGRSIWNTSLYG